MASAQSTAAKIVGLGAATCVNFTDDIEKSPTIQHEYLAWVQEFMSGILLSRPASVDEGWDLDPQKFGLHKLRHSVRSEHLVERHNRISEVV